MSLTCPHCHQPIEVSSREADPIVKCPACGRMFDVPNPLAGIPAKRKQSAADYRVRGVGGGGFKFLLFLALLVVGIVAIAMHRYHKSPREALQWVVDFAQGQSRSTPVAVTSKPTPPPLPVQPPPTTEPSVEPVLPTPPKPQPEPDPLAWIIAHKEHWPPEVTLKVDTVFPHSREWQRSRLRQCSRRQSAPDRRNNPANRDVGQPALRRKHRQRADRIHQSC